MEQLSLFILPLKIGVAAMAALWIVSLSKRDASVVDLWWAPGFAVGVATVWIASGAPMGVTQGLTLALIAAWSVRMTVLFLGRRRAHPGEDPRYADLRRAWGDGFWWKSLFIVFLLQAGLQWLIALAPLATVAAEPHGAGIIGVIGAMLAAAGLALEARADAELDAHKQGPRADAVCDSGLRAIVRYPNYLGEIGFWIGLWLIAASAGAWWTIVSPILIAVLLTRVSGAPILEERLAERDGGARWLATTPAFIPRRISDLLGRRSASSQ
jgi:steroid 5-alpha reductase family enzyme